MLHKMSRLMLALVMALITISLLILASCGSKPGTTTPHQTQPTTQAPTEEQVKELVVVIDKPNFTQVGGDVATNKGTPAMMITHNVFDTLVKRDKDNNIIPSLAKSWEWGAEYLSITFKLRDDVKFHNGDAFTAEDVKFSMQTYMREDKAVDAGPEFRRMIESVETLDDYTVRFNFTQLYTRLFDRLADKCAIIPKGYYSQDEAYFVDHPIGTGPFRWLEYKQDDYLKFEAVPNHWRKTPDIKYLTIRFVPEASTRMAMLKTGEADIISLASANIPEVINDPLLNLVWSKNVSMEYLSYGDLAFPDQDLPFQNEKVRLAAKHAIDVQSICKNLLLGKGEPCADHVPPWLPGYDPEYASDIVEYNPEKAKQLLIEAGYPDGFDTKFTYRLTEQREMEAVGAYLEAVGIRCKLLPVDDGAWVDTVMNKTETGLVYNQIWWGGNTHIYNILSGRFTTDTKWGYVVNDQTESAVRPLSIMLPADEMATLTRERVEILKDYDPGMLLWANNVAFGVGPKVEYWENVASTEMPLLLEYAVIK